MCNSPFLLPRFSPDYFVKLRSPKFRRVYPLTRTPSRSSRRGTSAIRLIHFAHFKLITCDAQKQGPTLPHVYSTRRLFAEVLDTEVAIRLHDRPHSRSLNLASLPISHIGNRCFAERAKSRGGGEKNRLFRFRALFLWGRGIAVDRVRPDYLSIRDDGGPFFGGGSWPTEAAASIPLGASTFARSELTSGILSRLPYRQTLPRSFSRSQGATNLSGLPWFRSKASTRLFTEVTASRFRVFRVFYIPPGTFSRREFLVKYISLRFACTYNDYFRRVMSHARDFPSFTFYYQKKKKKKTMP